MSSLYKNPVTIPANIEVKIDGDTVSVKGPKGELHMEKRDDITMTVKDNTVVIQGASEKVHKAFLGLTRSLLLNMIAGVTEGFAKKLELEGVGFKVALQGNKLVMQLGFSHPVEFEAPQGILLGVEKNVISVVGIDKYLVGQTAANIRKLKKPEPYKGKGIRYQGEVIRRKEGKKAGTV